MGIMNISNRQLYAIVERYFIKKDALDMDIAGADVLMLGLTAVFYFVLVFIIEYARTKTKITKFLSSEKNHVEYKPH